jgi:bifunctional DNA-binding transcriptional regulator/antitoxin component of YhaV-PrlF toxin-antitoxin module
VRRKLAIKEGTRIQIEVDEKARKIILTPITREYIQSLHGKYRGKGLLKALMEEKKREREL